MNKTWTFDVLILAGLALVGYGLWQWSPELSETVVGAILLSLGIRGYAAQPLRRR